MMMFGKFLIVALLGVTAQAAPEVEIPKWTVLARAKDHYVELRLYEPIIIAEVEIEATRDSATSAGFGLLAGYIFGNNRARGSVDMTAPVQTKEGESASIPMTSPVQTKESENIDMTSPVNTQEKSQSIPMTSPVNTQEKSQSIPMTAPVNTQESSESIAMTAPVNTQESSESIAMTAPVNTQEKNENIPMTSPVQTQESQNIPMTSPVQTQESEQIKMTAPVQEQEAGSGGSKWLVSFVMPSKYTLDTLPVPNDDRVKLKQMPQQKFLAIRYSGWETPENMNKHETILMKYVKSNNLKTIAPPTYAQYNEPWIPGFMRRNEILVEVE